MHGTPVATESLSSSRGIDAKSVLTEEDKLVPENIKHSFGNMNEVVITQSTAAMNCTTILHYKQRFRVMVANHKTKSLEKAFKLIKEESFCQDCCTLFGAGAVNMHLFYPAEEEKAVNNDHANSSEKSKAIKKKNWQPLLWLHKDHCIRLCGEKSILSVEFDLQGLRKTLGYFTFQSTCTEYSYRMFKSIETVPIYSVSTSKCQLGIHCKCGHVEFAIKNAKGEVVGEIRKSWPGCGCGDKDGAVKITLPAAASWSDKAMLVLCGLYIAEAFFEQTNRRTGVNC